MTTATTTRETERKYELADQVELPDPATLLGSPDSRPERVLLVARYFDTEDLRLLRAGITLRCREGGADAGWHLKLPAGPDSRDEVRLPLGPAARAVEASTALRTGAAGTMTPSRDAVIAESLAAEARQPPAELAGLVRVFTRGVPLRPVAELRTDRTRWLLADRRGREVAELVSDQVHGHTLGARTTAVSWHELEVELRGRGDHAVLERVEQRLLGAGARRSASSSKLGRVLGPELAGAGSRPDGARPTRSDRKPGTPQPAGASAGAALLAYLRAQADALRAHDPAVRRDQPDAVHQARVAARRFRSGLQAYGRLVDRADTRPLVDELRWLGRELADARDGEVVEQRLERMIARVPDELLLGPIDAHTRRILARRRADGRERALTALDSDRYLRLHDQLDALLADPPFTARAGRKATKELPKSVRRADRRTVSRMRAAERAAAGPERDRALHETRKAAKRLRYAAEVARPELGKPADRLVERLEKVQKHLGAHQDAVVARLVLRELAVQAHLDGGNGFTYGLLHAHEAARAEAAERALPARWSRLRTAARRLH
jgi:CHAD domain-containing protein